VRTLYVDISPGEGWDGRDPEALLAATATALTPLVLTMFDAAGLSALAAVPRPLAVLVGGATPSDAPAMVTLTGTDEDDAPLVEVVRLRRSLSSGLVLVGATSGREVFKTLTQVDVPAGEGTGATVSVGFGLLPGTGDVRRRFHFPTLWEALGDRSLGTLAQLDDVRLTGHCEDVSREIDGKLATPNGNYSVPFLLSQIGDVGRIALDLFVAAVGEHYPNVVEVDHSYITKKAKADLMEIRTAMASVGKSPPDPAANVGGATGAIGIDAEIPATFTSCLGDFA
jgi:hypothetical protein